MPADRFEVHPRALQICEHNNVGSVGVLRERMHAEYVGFRTRVERAESGEVVLRALVGRRRGKQKYFRHFVLCEYLRTPAAPQ